MNEKIEDYILDILISNFDADAKEIYNKSYLIQYFNLKSNAIHGNSKTRRSLANWYAIYSILYFYNRNGFVDNNKEYAKFEGFQYTQLFNFIRSLYGGSKLQNHALNSRVNNEFKNKITSEKGQLIINNGNRYLLNPSYLYVEGMDLTPIYIEIIEKYIELLIEKDNYLHTSLKRISSINNLDKKKKELLNLLNEDTEARIFEIISYAILSNHYKKTEIFIGDSQDNLKQQCLQLYKTGRTNANDGGIDFVMRPLGRFFQVTEVGNYDKYFLDIDKVLHFPITFVIKTNKEKNKIYEEMVEYADIKSGGHKIIKQKYLDSIEEIITINELKSWMNLLNDNEIKQMIEDIETYYNLEFNL